MKLIEISDEVSYEFDGHIPGAVPAGKEYWREQGDDGVRTHLPISDLQDRVRTLGIDDGDHVVLYYKGHSVNEIQGTFYAYWIFDLLGHDAVSILDGGWHAWQAAGGEMDETKVDPTPGDFTARHRPELEMGVDVLHSPGEGRAFACQHSRGWGNLTDAGIRRSFQFSVVSKRLLVLGKPPAKYGESMCDGYTSRCRGTCGQDAPRNRNKMVSFSLPHRSR